MILKLYIIFCVSTQLYNMLTMEIIMTKKWINSTFWREFQFLVLVFSDRRTLKSLKMKSNPTNKKL